MAMWRISAQALINSPTKSTYVNVAFVFDASTLFYCDLLFLHDNLLGYWLSSMYCQLQFEFSRFEHSGSA